MFLFHYYYWFVKKDTKNILLRKPVIVMLIVIKISLYSFKKNKYKLWKTSGYFHREVNSVETKKKPQNPVTYSKQSYHVYVLYKISIHYLLASLLLWTFLFYFVIIVLKLCKLWNCIDVALCCHVMLVYINADYDDLKSLCFDQL